MREILFRGKDANGNWHKGFIRQIWSKIGEKERFVICPSMAFEADGWTDTGEVEVNPETVGQFTGLTDKNGVKIFEGDMILHKDYSKGACITFNQFESKSAVNIDNLMKGCSSLRGLPAQAISSKHMQVIGNIHDNPELLNQ